jgi:putative chitinase
MDGTHGAGGGRPPSRGLVATLKILHGGGPPAPHPVAPPVATVRAGGAAHREVVSLAALRAIMRQLARAKAERHLAPLNEAMTEFHVTTRLRKAAFLAQIAHESHELVWFHELASGWEYDVTTHPKKARELGNLSKGDGPRYKGRGPIQLTGRANYRAAGHALGLDLEGHPDQVAEPAVAFRTSAWFWSSRGLNDLADHGHFREITHRVNGGYTHHAERLEYYERALEVFREDKGEAGRA